MWASNVLMFILVWTFTAVCQADEDISVSCEDVTGTLKKEVTLTCSVSLKKSKCCITLYKFQYPEKYNDPAICREEFPQDCERRNSFTCRFSPTTVMTGQFRFFVQITCGHEDTEFTVNITETSKPGPDTEDLEDISVSCEDVTGTVGEEVTLTCSVSLKSSESCIILYKFQYPEKYNDSAICREDSSCIQRNSFTCRFSPTTVMMEQFRFFVQTNCGTKYPEFTVDITETSKPEPVTEDPGKKETSKPEPDTEDPGKKERNDDEDPEEPIWDPSETSKHDKAEGRGFKVAVIAAAVSCFIIVIMPIIYKMNQNYKQKRMFLDNIPENRI